MNLEKETDELGAHSVGNTLLITALAGALIDSGAITLEGLTRSLKAFADVAANDMTPMSLTPFRQLAMLLEAGAGPNGHAATVELTALNDFLDRLGRGYPASDEGDR